MSAWELVDRDGDTGMVVFGTMGLDSDFRQQADAVGRTDERLIDVTPESLLEAESLRLAAAGGYLALMGANNEKHAA